VGSVFPMPKMRTYIDEEVGVAIPFRWGQSFQFTGTIGCCGPCMGLYKSQSPFGGVSLSNSAPLGRVSKEINAPVAIPFRWGQSFQ